jgi:hypothetical protein
MKKGSMSTTRSFIIGKKARGSTVMTFVPSKFLTSFWQARVAVPFIVTPSDPQIP